MTARTVFRLCATAAIIAGFIGIPAGFAGNNDLFVKAGWIWLFFTAGQIAAMRRMRTLRSRENDHDSTKENDR
jgi:hypothetical protein